MKIKECYRCKKEMPATAEYFHRDKTRNDGLRAVCKQCGAQYRKQYYQANREKEIERKKQYRQANKEKIAEYQKQYYQANKEEQLEYKKQHYQTNKEKYFARAAKRRAAKLQATPSWLSEEHKTQIEIIYQMREGLSDENVTYHVDHIVPLRGENISGLHVPWNLQIMPEQMNISKNNTLSFCE